MKKCVEFVADRVASNYIKRFRAKVLPDYLNMGTGKISELVEGLVHGQYDHKTKVGTVNLQILATIKVGDLVLFRIVGLNLALGSGGKFKR